MKILSILSDHRFIGFDRMKVLLPDGCKIEMPTQSPFIKYLCRFRSLVRLFRLEPRCATFLTEDILILAFLRKLWFISLSKFGRLFYNVCIKNSDANYSADEF